MGPPESALFRVLFLTFPCFLVFSRLLSSHPVVPFCTEVQKVSFSSLLTERHYRVRGKEDRNVLFPVFSRAFLVFSAQIQAAPLITLRKRCQKVSFDSF